MDQLSAHLDRGWELVHRGDFDAALLSATKAVEKDEESPEAHNLLGYVHAAKGDAEAALQHYHEALELDEDFVEAMLNAAEVLLHPLHQPDEALRMLEEVLDFEADDDEDSFIDAALLKVDALLMLERTEEAKQCLRRASVRAGDHADFAFALGRAHVDVGDAKQALVHLNRAVKADPAHADAHYFLALAHEALDREREATAAYLLTRQLDTALPPPPWSMHADRFAERVRRLLAQLPSPWQPALTDTLVACALAPGVEAIADGADPRAALLVDRARHDDEDANASHCVGEGATAATAAPRIAHIFVYQRNVERLAHDALDVDRVVREHLMSELEAAFEAPGMGRSTGRESSPSTLQTVARRQSTESRSNAAGPHSDGGAAATSTRSDAGGEDVARASDDRRARARARGERS
ncbi:MAG: tetratricopeptide repeat protein [Polyangiales bacterium]